MDLVHRFADWITYYPHHFHSAQGRALLDAAPDYPVYATLLYFWAVFYLPGYLKKKNNKVFNITYFVAGWNLFLSLISLYGAVTLLGIVVQVSEVRSAHSCVCEVIGRAGGQDIIAKRARQVEAHNEILKKNNLLSTQWVRNTPEEVDMITSLFDGPGGFTIAAFAYLKTPELLDTVFLILQGKPVSFLHWYHHILTSWYCWATGYMPIPSGIYFATMNYCVHAIMYFYYFLVVMGLRKKIRWFAPVITLLQVTQMFAGMGLTIYTYFQYWLAPEFSSTFFYQFFYYIFSFLNVVVQEGKWLVTHGTFVGPQHLPALKMENLFWGCDSDPSNLRIAGMMYGSYCVLFATLFKELYLDKRVKKNSLVLKRKQQEKEEEVRKAEEQRRKSLS